MIFDKEQPHKIYSLHNELVLYVPDVKEREDLREILTVILPIYGGVTATSAMVYIPKPEEKIASKKFTLLSLHYKASGQGPGSKPALAALEKHCRAKGMLSMNWRGNGTLRVLDLRNKMPVYYEEENE